jgi:hypothetical protein
MRIVMESFKLQRTYTAKVCREWELAGISPITALDYINWMGL